MTNYEQSGTHKIVMCVTSRRPSFWLKQSVTRRS